MNTKSLVQDIMDMTNYSKSDCKEILESLQLYKELKNESSNVVRVLTFLLVERCELDYPDFIKMYNTLKAKL